MNIRLLSSVKNEGPFLLEWIAHHKVIGFDQILIAYNDCTDGSTELLEKLAEHGEIQVFENVLQEGDQPQSTAYSKLMDSAFIQDADWLYILDADEFLNVHVGNGMVQDLIAHCGDVDLVQLNWMTFGSGAHENWDNSPVTLKFTQAATGSVIFNAGVKAFTRSPKDFRMIFNHHPGVRLDKCPIKCMDGRGDVFEYPWNMKASDERSPRHFKANQIAHEIAQINHYAIKTLDSFCIRSTRGRGFNDGNKRHSLKYFMDIALNANSSETSIGKYSNKMQAELNRLKSLPEIQFITDTIEALYLDKTQEIQRMYENKDFEEKYL